MNRPVYPDPTRFPSPCFVTDLDKLRRNAAILDGVQRRTGARVLLALKGFAQWSTFPSCISCATVSATVSTGTLGSARCW